MPRESIAEKTIMNKIQRPQNLFQYYLYENPAMQKPATVSHFAESLSIYDLLKAIEISKENHPPVEMELS